MKNLNLKCSITVETAMVFTLMMLILFMNMGPMFVCKTCVDIISKLDKCTKNLSYLIEVDSDDNVKDVKKLLSDEFLYDLDISIDKENMEGIYNLINTSLVTYLLLKDNDNVDNPFCNIEYVVPNDMDVYDSDTNIITYDFDIDFRQPLNILNVVGIKQRFLLSRRPFIGSDGNRQYNERVATSSNTLFIANDYKDTKIYHTYRDCSYLEKKVTKKSYSEVKNVYKRCKYCIKDISSLEENMYYITDTGENYHLREDCPTMTAYVTCVDKNFVDKNELRLCSRCDKRKGGGG